MRIIHHHARAVLLGQTADFRQIRDIAAHGKHAVRHNQATAVFRNLLQLLFQILHIVVPKAQHFSVAQSAAVIKAGMIFSVHDDVIVHPDNGADNAQI